MKKNKKSNTPTSKPKPASNFHTHFLWAVWIIYSIVVIYVTAHHEPWRDEAQSWLIARDNSLIGLFQYLPNEGHPPLWYLILMPFAKCGFPYFTANILHNVIIIAFAWVLLFRVRLAIWLSIPLLFSYFFLYEYAVIARNYSIVALLLAIAGAIYEQRFSKPFLYAAVVFLLFQTNILAFCTGVGLGLLFFWEMLEQKKITAKYIASMLIMISGGVSMLLLLLSAGMKSSYSKEATDKWMTLQETFGNAMFLDKEMGALGIVVYLLILLSLFRKPKALVFLIVATSGFLYLALYQFQGTLRHQGFLMMFLLAASMISKMEKPLRQFNALTWTDTAGSGIFAFVLFLQVFRVFPVLADEIERNFSDSKNAADFLIQNKLDRYTIVGHRSYAASAVAPYLYKPIWYADQQRYGTFVYLDTVFFNNYLKYNADYAPYVVAEKFQKKDSMVLLLNMPIQYPEFLREWQLVYQTTQEPIKRDEIYFIYQYKQPTTF